VVDGRYLATVIQLKDVYKAFGPKKVLQGFTLDIPDGETMVIIGYSGTGKSVAIKHIVGLLEPDAGEVWVDGLRVDALPRRDLYRLRSKIGYVFQFAALFDSLTIGENVAMGLRKQGELSDQEIRFRVAEALSLVDLPGVEQRFPAELSGGMRKRVGIARAIALRPKLVILDEPTAALDVSVQAVVLNLLQDLKESMGMSYLFVSHDLNVVRLLCERVIVMRSGRIVEQGPSERVLGAPQDAYTRELLSAIPHPPLPVH